MAFYNGLVKLIKKPVFLFVVFTFTMLWLLIFLGNTFLTFIQDYFLLISIIASLLFGFCVILLILSFFKKLDEIKAVYLLIAFIFGIPFLLFFTLPIFWLYAFSIFVNHFITAFFAFKICMDNSTKVDDFLNKQGKARIFLRTIEFLLFGFLSWWLLTRLFVNYFNTFITIQLILRVIFWVDFVLMMIVLLRALIIKKFAAYITLFFTLSSFYIFYILISLISDLLFPDTTNFQLTSFIIELILFFYIIGAILDKVDYLKEKLKIFRADTIAIFVILMKLLVQVSKIVPSIPELQRDLFILIIFILFTLFFGIYTIFIHKSKK